eukprot:g3042.t1
MEPRMTDGDREKKHPSQLSLLALHGNKQCGEIFSQRIAGFVKRCSKQRTPRYSLTFADGGHDLALEDGQSVPMKTWWPTTDDADDDDGEAGWHSSLEQLVASHGDGRGGGPKLFHGIVGFSQGSNAAWRLATGAGAAERAARLALFGGADARPLLIVSGGYLTESQKAVQKGPGSFYGAPTLHIIGSKDRLVTPAMSQELADRCYAPRPTYHRHDQGHCWPQRKSDIDAVMAFLSEHSGWNPIDPALGLEASASKPVSGGEGREEEDEAKVGSSTNASTGDADADGDGVVWSEPPPAPFAPAIEEQAEEIEALVAIFEDACEIVSGNEAAAATPCVKLSMADTDSASDEVSAGDGGRAAALLRDLDEAVQRMSVRFALGPAYPEAAGPSVGLDASALDVLLRLARARMPLALDKTPAARALRAELFAELKELAAQCVGGAMLFDLHSSIKEWIVQRREELAEVLATGVGIGDGGTAAAAAAAAAAEAPDPTGSTAAEAAAGLNFGGNVAGDGGIATAGTSGGGGSGGKKATKVEFQPLDPEVDARVLRSAAQEAAEADARLGPHRWNAAGRWDYVVGLVGKPSAGKSTFFNGRGHGNAFLNDLVDADVLVHIVDVSATTDTAGNDGRAGGVGDEDDATSGGKDETQAPPAVTNATEGAAGACGDGSVAPLVETELAGAEATSPGGRDTGEVGDPVADIEWIRDEIHHWIYDNVTAKWTAIRRRPEKLISMFSGYHATDDLVFAALGRAGLPSTERELNEKLPLWPDPAVKLHRLVAHFLRIRFPVLLALNKADLPTAARHVQRVAEAYPLETARRAVCPVSAQLEWKLLEWAEHGFLLHGDYVRAECLDGRGKQRPMRKTELIASPDITSPWTGGALAAATSTGGAAGGLPGSNHVIMINVNRRVAWQKKKGGSGGGGSGGGGGGGGGGNNKGGPGKGGGGGDDDFGDDKRSRDRDRLMKRLHKSSDRQGKSKGGRGTGQANLKKKG